MLEIGLQPNLGCVVWDPNGPSEMGLPSTSFPLLDSPHCLYPEGCPYLGKPLGWAPPWICLSEATGGNPGWCSEILMTQGPGSSLPSGEGEEGSLLGGTHDLPS